LSWLGRSTAHSKQIQANNYARLIRQLGSEPEAQIQPAEVKTVLENLTAALVEEVYEIDSMYPRFLAENMSTNNSAAETLTWALEAERTNARLFSEQVGQMGAAGADSLASTPSIFSFAQSAATSQRRMSRNVAGESFPSWKSLT
jgi:rubrerythrin